MRRLLLLAVLGLATPGVAQAQTGVPNPNAELLRELMDFGTQVILCGQTAA